MNPIQLNRRDFLTYTGLSASGLLLGCATAKTTMLASAVAGHTVVDTTPESLNIFISIGTDNQIHIVNHRSEMGQGSKTGIIQLLADELDVDWQNIHVIQGLGDYAYGSQNTDGSTSIRGFYDKMREMGASAKAMLVGAAATFWQVDVSQVEAKNQTVTNKVTGKQLTYGDLAELAAIQPVPDVKQLTLKNTNEFNYIGKPVAAIDLDNITTGNTVFGIDHEMPDMLTAVIARCPVLHGKVKSVDDTAARKIPGVIDIINMPETTTPVVFNPLNGVAVLATNTWAAMKARDALVIEWDLGKNKTYNSEDALADMTDKVSKPAKVVGKKGDIEAGFKKAKTVIEAHYSVPFEAHAPMEPPMASALVTGDKCEIWASTQNPQAVMKHAAKLLGTTEDKIKVNVTLLGGGFGRKSKADFSLEAAFLSKASGKPVKVVWTREDDIQSGYFHAGSAQYMKAGVNGTNITAWLQRASYPSIFTTFSPKNMGVQGFELSMGYGDLPFEIENYQAESAGAQAAVRIGWMRSVCNIQHGFALHSFVDELAHSQNIPTPTFLKAIYGKDRTINPKKEYNFTYKNYSEPLKKHAIETSRYQAILDKLTQVVNFDEKLPKGQGWGIAIHRSFVSYVGVATKVEVNNGKLSVLDVQCAVDCGTVVNPDRVSSQMEGAMIFGLSLTLMGKIDIENGAVVQSNFHDYPMLRMSQSPNINVHLIPNGNYPGGVGEPGVPPLAPSVTNAIFAATGERYRKLPLNQYLSV